LVVEVDSIVSSKTENYLAVFTAQLPTPIEINFEMQALETAIAQEQSIHSRRYVFESLDANDTSNGTTNGTDGEEEVRICFCACGHTSFLRCRIGLFGSPTGFGKA